MNKNLIIILLAIISVGTVGYIVYDKVSESKKEDGVKTENNSDKIVSDHQLEDFTKIVNEELEFFVSQEKLDDITNEEKTYLLYYLLDDKTEVTVDKLENVRKNSSLREMNVKYTDIYDSYESFVLIDDVLRSLDKQTGKYSDYLTGHGGLMISSHSFLQDFKIDNNKYILSYKYVFIKAQGEGPTDLDMYYTFEDAVKKTNRKKEFIWDVQTLYKPSPSAQADTYAENNYESFKDELDTYNYVFEIHDGNIVLVDFYRN